MSDYERVSLKQGDPKIVSKRVYYQLRELEDKIENGTLIELPCLLTPYYLSGEWHCKILKGFDEHSVPCMEYFHGKTKEEVENKAEKKLEELRGKQ
jgi:hypothetical protein